MSLLRKIIGPKSKYDKTIPYAFMAKIYVTDDSEELCRYFYGDTICSLIEHLESNDISPEEVKLYGLYKGEEIELETEICTNEDGKWLMKPELCRKLENYYKETLDKRFKGHVEIGTCMFDDRDENVI